MELWEILAIKVGLGIIFILLLYTVLERTVKKIWLRFENRIFNDENKESFWYALRKARDWKEDISNFGLAVTLVAVGGIMFGLFIAWMDGTGTRDEEMKVYLSLGLLIGGLLIFLVLLYGIGLSISFFITFISVLLKSGKNKGN